MIARRTWAGVFIGLLPAASACAQAADVAELQRRLEEQEQKTAVLERRLEIQEETTKAALPNAPIIKGGAAGGADRDDENALLTRVQLSF